MAIELAQPDMKALYGFDTGRLRTRGAAFVAQNPQSDGPESQTVVSRIRFVTRQSEIASYLNVSARASLRSGAISGNAAVDFLTTSTVKTNSCSILVYVSVENTPKVVKLPPKWRSPDVKRQYEEDNALFTATYGDSFILGFVEGGELYILFTLTDESSEAESKLRADMDASNLKGDSVGVSILQRLKTVLSAHSFDIAMKRVGGTGPLPETDADSILTYALSFPQSILASPTKIRALTMEYSSQFYRGNPASLEKKHLILNSIGELYLTYSAKLKQIRALIAGGLDEAEMTQLNKGAMEAESAMMQLLDLAERCYEGKQCESPSLELREHSTWGNLPPIHRNSSPRKLLGGLNGTTGPFIGRTESIVSETNENHPDAFFRITFDAPGRQYLRITPITQTFTLWLRDLSSGHTEKVQASPEYPNEIHYSTDQPTTFEVRAQPYSGHSKFQLDCRSWI